MYRSYLRINPVFKCRFCPKASNWCSHANFLSYLIIKHSTECVFSTSRRKWSVEKFSHLTPSLYHVTLSNSSRKKLTTLSWRFHFRFLRNYFPNISLVLLNFFRIRAKLTSNTRGTRILFLRKPSTKWRKLECGNLRMTSITLHWNNSIRWKPLLLSRNLLKQHFTITKKLGQNEEDSINWCNANAMLHINITWCLYSFRWSHGALLSTVNIKPFNVRELVCLYLCLENKICRYITIRR